MSHSQRVTGEKRVDAPSARLTDALRILGRPRFETQHGNQHVCPGCGQDNNVAVVTLVYAFEECSCGKPDYTHLIEQCWHRGCFVLKN